MKPRRTPTGVILSEAKSNFWGFAPKARGKAEWDLGEGVRGNASRIFSSEIPNAAFAAFDPRFARISTTLRMTRTKKHEAEPSGISGEYARYTAINTVRGGILRYSLRPTDE